MAVTLNFFARTAEYFLHNRRWLLLTLLSGFFLYRLLASFLAVRPGRIRRAALVILLGGSSMIVIWLGDPNLLYTLAVFLPLLLACSQGDPVGRLAVAMIFFCLIMPVNAAIDTYYGPIMSRYDLDDAFFYTSQFLRPAIWGLLYLAARRRLPERPPRLSPRLWKLVLLLAVMPFSSLLAVVLLTCEGIYHSSAVHGLTMNLGLAVLPFVFLTALALLYAIRVLEDHEHLEQADRLASLRESYYQALRREERQVRTLRHDLRNHLTAVRGLLEQGETAKAIGYLEEIAGGPALGGNRRICENETANAVLAAKAEAIDRAGLRGEFAVSLPPELPVADTDLCALLGNALDNAIEAAEQAVDKGISVRCRVEKGLFMLRVENAAAAALQPQLPTTKADRAAHGFGLPGMREIAERYGGSLDARQQNGRFELVVCLPLEGGRQI